MSKHQRDTPFAIPRRTSILGRSRLGEERAARVLTVSSSSTASARRLASTATSCSRSCVASDSTTPRSEAPVAIVFRGVGFAQGATAWLFVSSAPRRLYLSGVFANALQRTRTLAARSQRTSSPPETTPGIESTFTGRRAAAQQRQFGATLQPAGDHLPHAEDLRAAASAAVPVTASLAESV